MTQTKQTIELLSIFVSFTLAIKVVHYLNPAFVKSNQIAKKNSQLTSEFFRVLYDVTKIDFFCSTKDKTPTLNQSFVVYEFVCPGCSANYVGKTERTLFKRNVEHAWNDKDSVVNIHLNECNGVQHMFNIAKLTPSLFSDSVADDVQDPRMSHINLVQINTRIIDRHKNWNILLFKEAIKVKEKKPILNTGLKTSKELQLF